MEIYHRARGIDRTDHDTASPQRSVQIAAPLALRWCLPEPAPKDTLAVTRPNTLPARLAKMVFCLLRISGDHPQAKNSSPKVQTVDNPGSESPWPSDLSPPC